MGRRLFRALLLLLPAEFRADYGRDMEATFQAEAAEASGLVRLRLWAATIADLARTAPAEHLDIGPLYNGSAITFRAATGQRASAVFQIRAEPWEPVVVRADQ